MRGPPGLCIATLESNCVIMSWKHAQPLPNWRTGEASGGHLRRGTLWPFALGTVLQCAGTAWVTAASAAWCVPQRKLPCRKDPRGKPLADVSSLVMLPEQHTESSVNCGLLPFQKSYPGPAGRSAWWWQQEPTELPLPSLMFVVCSGCSPPCGCWLRAEVAPGQKILEASRSMWRSLRFFSVCLGVVGDALKHKN